MDEGLILFYSKIQFKINQKSHFEAESQEKDPHSCFKYS